MAVAFEHLHLVAIRVLDKKIAGDQRAIVGLELLDVQRAVTQADQTRALGGHIGHANGDMAISVAVAIGLGAVTVPGQFDLGVVFCIAQIDQREGGKVQPVGGLQVKAVSVKLELPVQLPHADHAVDDF